MLNSKETTTSVEVRSSSREAPSIAEAITERSTTSQRYKDAKSKLVSSKVAATPDETMGDIDGPNSTSSSQQNKNTCTYKRRGSTDLLLIAAAQREASDSAKPASNNGCTGSRNKKVKNESSEGKATRHDHFGRELKLYGDLDETQRERLLEIAERCPVHRTLESKEVEVETKLV